MPNDFFAMTPESSSDMTLKQQAKQQRELHSIQINSIQCNSSPKAVKFFNVSIRHSSGRATKYIIDGIRESTWAII
jgi:hypothetical protein